MKVAIIGVGKLGTKVATPLLGGDHAITVIDINEEKLNKLSQQMDVLTVVGNGLSIKLLESCGIDKFDFLVASTDSDENIRTIASFLKGRKNLKRYEILNYNPLGEGKYKALNVKNDFENARPFGKERLDEIKAILDETGIDYKII